MRESGAPLVVLNFESCSITYTAEFHVVITGTAYPRHLDLANQTIQHFKVMDRDDRAAAAAAAKRDGK